MRKILVASLLLITILLSACGTKTATPVSPTPTSTTTAATIGAQPGECKIAASILQPQPASAATFAPISSSDHIEGPDSAVMTVVEYSDFT